jgi:hypothetical protein
MTKLYPITCDIKVMVVNENDEVTGTVTYEHVVTKLPTEEDMVKILPNVLKSLPEGFRLANRAEIMNAKLQEAGARETFVIPRPDEGEEWFDPETVDHHVADFLNITLNDEDYDD